MAESTSPAPFQSPESDERPFSSKDRRTFSKLILQVAASVGISATVGTQIVEALEKGLRPSIIWLHFQECTGCTESLLRTINSENQLSRKKKKNQS